MEREEKGEEVCEVKACEEGEFGKQEGEKKEELD